MRWSFLLGEGEGSRSECCLSFKDDGSSKFGLFLEGRSECGLLFKDDDRSKCWVSITLKQNYENHEQTWKLLLCIMQSFKLWSCKTFKSNILETYDRKKMNCQKSSQD